MSEPMIIEVERNEGHKCPFNDIDSLCLRLDRCYCFGEPPKNCPLLKGDVVVRMKKKTCNNCFHWTGVCCSERPDEDNVETSVGCKWWREK